jgi:hypothetical protein
MRNLSSATRQDLNSTSGTAPWLLLEISHPDLASPIRVAQGNDDVLSNGNLYVGIAFDFEFPDDMDMQLPRATLAIDNVGRELTQWIDASNGGEGAECRVMHVQRADPDVIEWEITLNLSRLRVKSKTVSGELGYEDLLNAPAVALTYRPDTAPGIF